MKLGEIKPCDDPRPEIPEKKKVTFKKEEPEIISRRTHRA